MSAHRFSILIVDDKPDEVDLETKLTRRKSYEQLDEQFELSFADSLAHFDQLIVDRRYDAFLIDFMLEGWGTTAATVLARLDGRYPIGLISSFWTENFEELRIVIDRHHEVKALFCWDDLRTKQRRGLIIFWLSKAIREYRNLASLALDSSEPIRLLQFSDFQFGGIGAKDFPSETHAMAEVIRSHWHGSGPTFILLTGDVAENGLPQEYDIAADWIARFSSAIAPGWTNDRLLLIPGNHDVCRPLALAATIDAAAGTLGGPLDERLSLHAFTPFRQFAASVTGDARWHDPGRPYWVSGQFRHLVLRFAITVTYSGVVSMATPIYSPLSGRGFGAVGGISIRKVRHRIYEKEYLGVIFFGYNTSETLDTRGRTTKAVRGASLAEMFADVRALHRDAPTGTIVIGLIHHPLAPADPKDALAEPRMFYRNMVPSDLTWVIATGHVHEVSASPQDQSGVQFLEIISATPTKEEAARPHDTLRGFNLIDLERKDGIPIRLKVTSCAFEGFRIIPRPEVVFDRPAGKGPFRRS